MAGPRRDEVRLGTPLQRVNRFQVLGDGNINPITARNDPASDGDSGLLIVFHTGGAPAVRRVKVGANGSGPGGVGRALYIDP
jgi:hypothetical protein